MNKKVASLCVLALGAAGIYGIVGESLKADDQQNETPASTVSTVNSSEKAKKTEEDESKAPLPETKETDGNEGKETEETQGSVEEDTTTSSESGEGTSSTEGISKEEEEEKTEVSKEETQTSTSDSSSQTSSSSTTQDSTTESKETTTQSSTEASKESESKETTNSTTPPEESTVEPEKDVAIPVVKEDKVEETVKKKKEETTNVPKTNLTENVRQDLSLGIINEIPVDLDSEFLVSEMAPSDLKGYELPLLNSFEDKNRAVLIYEGIKQLGEPKKDQENNDLKETKETKEKEAPHYVNGFTSTQDLLNQITTELFGANFYDIQVDVDKEESVKPGAVLYKGNELVGLYLGGEYYLTVKDEVVKDQETKKVVSIEKLTDQLKKELHQKVLGEVYLTEYGKKVEKAYPASVNFKKNRQTEDFIKTIGKAAQDLGEKYDIFASVMIAQAILESGSGSSQLSRIPNYNLFGMKGAYNGQSVTFATQEDRGDGQLYTIQAAFRRYNGYDESLGDYVRLLRGGIQGSNHFYKGAWRSEAKNYLAAADFLTGKYATDTKYSQKLSSIIAVYHLSEFDKPKEQLLDAKARQSGAILKGKENIPEAYKANMRYPDYNGKDYNTSGSYPVGQCTWYAYNRVAQIGKHVDEYMGNGGEWGETGKALGYHVTQVPKAGYLISFTPGTAGSDPDYGHVAFVEAVGPNGILISEGNVAGGTTISYRIIPNSLAKSSLVSYIEPK